MKNLAKILEYVTESEAASLIRAMHYDLGIPMQARCLTRLDYGSGGLTMQGPQLHERLLTAAFQSSQCMSQERPLSLLFRQVFFVPVNAECDPLLIRIQLKTLDTKASLYMLDNDSEKIVSGIDSDDATISRLEAEYCSFARNLNGYTIVGIADDSTKEADRNFQLSFIADGTRTGARGMLRPLTEDLATEFSYWELAGPYEPGCDGLLFRFSLKVSPHSAGKYSLFQGHRAFGAESRPTTFLS